MPIPEVKSGDTEKEFVAKCMEAKSKYKDLSDDNERKQALAICFSTFQRARGIKEDFKSMFQIIKESE